jgi:hypothetical protein
MILVIILADVPSNSLECEVIYQVNGGGLQPGADSGELQDGA